MPAPPTRTLASTLAFLCAAGCYTSHDFDVDGYDYLVDCDDEDESINPGAEEACGDLVDNNCDGQVDECCGLADLDEADMKLRGPSAQAGAGVAVGSSADLTGDGLPDLLVGAPNAEAHFGAVYLVSGAAGHSDLADAPVTIVGETAGDLAGRALAAAGDFDGDGNADLLVGAPAAGLENEGAAYLLLGPVTAGRTLADADARWQGQEAYARMGWAAAGGDDIDQDGYDDILVVAPGDPSGEISLGAVHLIHGRAREDDSLDASTEDLGPDLAEGTGLKPASATMVGDFDGDGVGDLLLGLTGHSDDECGIARLILGPELETSYDFTSVICENRERSGGVGTHVAGLGDVNADGYDDFIVGAPVDSTQTTLAGRAYLIEGSAEEPEPDLDEAPVRLEGEAAWHQAGVVAGPGDVNGDGKADILVGAEQARQQDGTLSGAAYLVFGPVSGSLSLDKVLNLGDADLRLYGEDDGDALGASLAGAGDVDQDGLADFLIGAPGRDAGGAEDAGAVYLLLGQPCP